MTTENKNNKKRVKLAINPEYLQQLKVIQAVYGYKSLNSMLVDIISGKKLSTFSLQKESSSINQHLSISITQALNNFKAIQDVALTGKPESVYKDLEKLRESIKAGHLEECFDRFDSQVTLLRESVEKLKATGTIATVDSRPNTVALRDRISEIDIHENTKELGKTQNLCLDLDESLYSKYFRKPSFKDPFNRRAFKHAIESNLEFYIESLNPDVFSFINSKLVELNDTNKKYNTNILNGDFSGPYDLFKTIVMIKADLQKYIKSKEAK
ncbi:hypothetical protein ACLF3K_000420 [Pseudomonas aeruginosa]